MGPRKTQVSGSSVHSGQEVPKEATDHPHRLLWTFSTKTPAEEADRRAIISPPLQHLKDKWMF